MLRIQTMPWYAGYSVAVIEMKDGKTYAACPLVLEPHEPMDIIEPIMTLDKKEAQILIDDLWQCGLRPSDGCGSVGELRATEKHLEDMRRLVFDRSDGTIKNV